MLYELQLDVCCKQCGHEEKCHVGLYENIDRFKEGKIFVGKCDKCNHKQLLIKKVNSSAIKKYKL